MCFIIKAYLANIAFMVFKNHIHININIYSYSQIKQMYFYFQQNRFFMYAIKIIFQENLMFKYEIIVPIQFILYYYD